jgi:dual specificity protein phosphatase-like protein
MGKVSARIRNYPFPYHDNLFGARLINIREESPTGEVSETGEISEASETNPQNKRDILFDIEELHLVKPPQPCGTPLWPEEWVEGEYHPRTLRLKGAEWVMRSPILQQLETMPLDHGARIVLGSLYWRDPKLGNIFLIFAQEPADCVLRVSDFALEERDGEPRPAAFLRRWANTPPHPAGLVPQRTKMLRRFAGDPITIALGNRRYRSRLFIGGIGYQTETRPEVDAVLNLCELDNPWVAHEGRHENDRFACKGEMTIGMDMSDLLSEARWVVGRLRAGQQVLVHCYAGVNRSSTVCCAALMLLEGLSAEDALARVRENHPSCRPDPYHWFLLERLHDALVAEALTNEDTQTLPALDSVSLLQSEVTVG